LIPAVPRYVRIAKSYTRWRARFTPRLSFIDESEYHGGAQAALMYFFLP
jgi:hypothetical protein